MRKLAIFLIGTAVTGIVEHIVGYYVWDAADFIMNRILQCSNLVNGWGEVCNQIGLYYYLGKLMFSVAGGLSLLGLIRIFKGRE